MTIASSKEETRRRALERRAAVKDAAADLSRLVAENFLAAIPLSPAVILSAYVAIKDEADPAPLIARARQNGARIALPRVIARGLPLDFHLFEEGARLVPGRFGLFEPGPGWPKIAPDILAVPLLGFDRNGHRIGYGAGFYDRTLELMRGSRHVLAVGFAFACQEFPELPHDEHDQWLDWVVTENAAIRIER